MPRKLSYYYDLWGYKTYTVPFAEDAGLKFSIGIIRPTAKCLWFTLDIIKDKALFLAAILRDDGIVLGSDRIILRRKETGDFIDWGAVDAIVADANANYKARLHTPVDMIDVDTRLVYHLGQYCRDLVISSAATAIEEMDFETDYGTPSSAKTVEVADGE